MNRDQFGSMVNLRSGRPTKMNTSRVIQEVTNKPRRNIWSTAGPTYMSYGRCSLVNSKRLGREMTSMGELRGGSHIWPKTTRRLVSHSPENILIIPETFGLIFCGRVREKFNFLWRCTSCYTRCKTNTAFQTTYASNIIQLSVESLPFGRWKIISPRVH